MKIKDKNGKYINYRKRQMIFRKIMLFVSIIIISSGLAFGAGSIASHAETPGSTQYYKYYTSITIEEGDSINSLAERYGEHFSTKNEFINEVIRTNHLTDDVLFAGMNLIVPYYSTEFVH